MSIVLNRFTLDYSTWSRVKVTDRVTFPRVLNLNNYLKGYDGIEGKQYASEVERMNLYRKDQVQRNLDSETIKHQKLSQRKETAKPSTGSESVV